MSDQHELPEIDLRFVSPHKPVSLKQAYVLAHLALERLGLPWPENRREASALIGELEDQE